MKFPEKWAEFLKGTPALSLLSAPLDRAAEARSRCEVFPPEELTFAAFELTLPETVKVVILGQDPYHEEHQAVGLAFAVPDGEKVPPSLRNIRKEYRSDMGCEPAPLEFWASSGVLLLNAVLTVEAHKAGSHAAFGWEPFTDAVIAALSQKLPKAVFILWGNFAAKKRCLIDETRHLAILSAHPSPLSASRGFFGSRPFSKAESFFAGSWRWPR